MFTEKTHERLLRVGTMVLSIGAVSLINGLLNEAFISVSSRSSCWINCGNIIAIGVWCGIVYMLSGLLTKILCKYETTLLLALSVILDFAALCSGPLQVWSEASYLSHQNSNALEKVMRLVSILCGIFASLALVVCFACKGKKCNNVSLKKILLVFEDDVEPMMQPDELQFFPGGEIYNSSPVVPTVSYQTFA